MIDAFIMQWWFWACLALAIILLEMMLPTGFFLGFALSAGMIALILFLFGATAFGVSQVVLLLSFAVLSLGATLLLRKLLQNKNYRVKKWDKDINE